MRCTSCVRYFIKVAEPFLRVFLTIFVAVSCSVLYYKSSKTILASKHIDRKFLLTAIFAAILILWMILVWPHVFYATFAVNNEFVTFPEALNLYALNKETESFFIRYRDFINQYLQDVSYLRSTAMRDNQTVLVDLILRVLRMSFGILNTLLVLIMLKPFHAPILSILRKIRSSLKSIYCFFVRIFAIAEVRR